MLFLPELSLLGAGLALFLFSLGKPGSGTIKNLVLTLATITLLASLLSINSEGTLFYASYKVDFFSQLFKMLIASATLIILIFSDKLDGIKEDIQPEYYLFLFMSVLGLMMLVSSVELLAIFISLELSSFAVYIMVPMRRPGKLPGSQAESPRHITPFERQDGELEGHKHSYMDTHCGLRAFDASKWSM